MFAFTVLLVVALWGINSFLQPIWFYENNYHTYRSFYDEPADTVETVFVGASMTLFGFSPMEMYAQNGICAYNLASTSQPIMMSYYWVKEAHRLQGGTLDTVVMDVSMLRRKSTEEDYRKALDGMDKGSPVKKEAIEDLADDSMDALYYQFPIFGYHDRWSALTNTDFLKYEDNIEDYVRGYYMDFIRVFDIANVQDIPVPAQLINPNEAPSTFEKESLFYLNKLLEFCKENNIRLVLCKTPSPGNWTSGDHNGVQQIADTYGLDFVDLEIEPHLSELAFCPPLDSRDTDKHLNSYGAFKLSRWMSTYLSQVIGNRDVRGDERYAFMDDQLRRYHDKVTLLYEATLSLDVAEYLEKVTSADNYTVLMAVRDDASNRVTSEQRLAFERMGLSKLAMSQFGDSYVAVVTNGEVEFEEVAHMPYQFDEEVEENVPDDIGEDDEEGEEGAEDLGDEEAEAAINLSEIEFGDWEQAEDESKDTAPLTKSGQLADGTRYTLKSGGSGRGFTASIEVAGAEQAKNSRGINIVVYDNDSHRVVDSAVFDVWASSLRDNPNLRESLDEALGQGVKYNRLTKNLQKLYRYDQRYRYTYEAKVLRQQIDYSGLYQFLDYYCHRDGLMVFVATRGGCSDGLDDQARAALAGLGLSGVSKLGSQDSYCAAFINGSIADERVTSGTTPATLEGVGYTLESAGSVAGNYCSIAVETSGQVTEYAPNGHGFNIVVYNPKLNIVVDTASFDTNAYGVSLP